MGGHVGLRGGAHVELQPPASLSSGFGTPQVDGADLGEPRVEGYRDGARLAAPPRAKHGANWRQRAHLLAVDGHKISRLVGQPRAGDEERELDRLGNEQLELAIGDLDVLPRLGTAGNKADGSRFFWRRAFDANVVGSRQPRRDSDPFSPAD